MPGRGGGEAASKGVDWAGSRHPSIETSPVRRGCKAGLGKLGQEGAFEGEGKRSLYMVPFFLCLLWLCLLPAAL